MADDQRYPLTVQLSDLESTQLVVALKEAEHRPLLDRLLPGWSVLTEFWHVDDLDLAEPRVALAEIEEQVHALVQRLQREEGADRDRRMV